MNNNSGIMIFSCFFLLTIIGCETMDRTEKGAAIGAVTGAGVGGVIGHQSARGGQGALLGGLAGTVAGGLIGHQMDKHQKEINPQHISIVEVAKMGDEGVPSKALIEELKRTQSVYKLDSETINYLKEHGVKDDVIDYMLSTSKG